MAARPQNIGIKAIELYFPSQASPLEQRAPSQCCTSLYPSY